MSQGVRAIQLRLDHAFLFTAVMTVLTASAWFNNALWMFNWLLLCPAHDLLATARRPNRN